MPHFTRDQERAQFAWKFVENHLNGLGPKDFAKACKNASTRIMNAGLAGALAFSISKSGKKGNVEEQKYDRVASALAQFLGKRAETPTVPREDLQVPRQYLHWLIGRDAMTLRAETDEAMALLQWLARLADGKAVAIGDKGGADV